LPATGAARTKRSLLAQILTQVERRFEIKHLPLPCNGQRETDD